MLKSVEDINTTKKRLRIEIPSEVIEGEIKNSLDQLRQRAKIPGFRQGKAPVTLIEKRFGKEVESEVLERIMPEQLSNAIREAALDPITMPTLEEEFRFTRNNPITLSVIVEVAPKIENLDYDNIAIKDVPAEVEESDIEDALGRLQDQKAVYEVADKEIEMDDYVSFEYVDSKVSGGVEIPGAKEVISKMGNEIFPADIMERVLGKKKGDVIEFTTAFNETGPKELVGKTADIKVTITEVKKKVLPAIDEEFAKDLGLGNVAELREKVHQRILLAKQEQVRKLQKAQIVGKLIDTYAVEVPETLLQRELDGLVAQESIDAKGDEVQSAPSGDVPVATVAAGSPEENTGGMEDPRTRLKEKALRNARASLIIDAIGRKEGITVSESEVEERISILAGKLSATPESLLNFYRQRGGLENLKHAIFEDKVMDLLLSKAVIEKENK